MNTTDSYDLFEIRERRQGAWLKTLPVCEKCHKPIQDDYYFYINDETLCQSCMEDRYMLSTEDYG